MSSKEAWLTSDGHIDTTTFYGQLLSTKRTAIITNSPNGNEPPRWKGSLDANTRGILRLVICGEIPEEKVTAFLGQQGLIDAMTSHLENLSDPVKPNNPNTPIERQIVGQWLAEHGVSK